MFLRCIKLWARRKGVYSNIVGFPGGVAWAIMAVNICQLYPNMIPSMLLEKFFFVYANWDFAKPIKIAPLDECRAPPGPVYMPQWTPAVKRPMQIITPTYPVANATFNSSRSTVLVVKQEIAGAHQLSQDVSAGRVPFSAMFSASDFFVKYSNYVSVDVIAYRAEAMKPFYAYIESQIRSVYMSVYFRPQLDSKPPFWILKKYVIQGLKLSWFHHKKKALEYSKFCTLSASQSMHRKQVERTVGGHMHVSIEASS
jgi:poly(A) polymerase